MSTSPAQAFIAGFMQTGALAVFLVVIVFGLMILGSILNADFIATQCRLHGEFHIGDTVFICEVK